MSLRAPFPYLGGKRRVAPLVWARFGDVPNYVEPFAGSLAVLLGRPTDPRIETVNDADCFLANFWRALQHAPEQLAALTAWPVNEADLHARHRWLVQTGAARVARLRTDPEYYDIRVAAWWVWGICQWIGSGWCASPEWQQRPHLGDAGKGVHRPSQQLPHLRGAGMGVHRQSDDLPLYFAALADRLARVRVCCGDWSRVLGPTPTTIQGLTGVFLDPPYSDEAGRQANLYSVDSGDVAHAVREWAIENGDNPLLRIALCGYEGEHTMPETWTATPWKAHGGYGNQGNGTGRANAAREMIWFSQNCLSLETVQPSLFEAAS